jgi:hypothetical protein
MLNDKHAARCGRATTMGKAKAGYSVHVILLHDPNRPGNVNSGARLV